MKKKNISEEQIVAILREAETGKKAISTICREQAISETTFYKWRKQYGGMEVGAVKRLQELEKETARLKRLLAKRDLEIDVMKEALAKKW